MPRSTRPRDRERRPRTPPAWLAGLSRWCWVALVALAAGALATPWLPLTAPAWLPTAGAVSVTVGYAVALAVRSGGRPVLVGLLALALSLAAVLTGEPVLVAGAAVSTAALGAVLGVVLTVPAARFVGVVREVAVAVLVAVVAALAAVGYDARVSYERAGYLVLGLGLVGALVLVYRLGAGFHGLGRRGLVVVLGGLALLAVSLAYTEALARWGSPEVVASVREVRAEVRATLGAVPRALDVLLGIPALAWGVSTRARRRQGWWACAFGATALAGASASLMAPRVSLLEAGLSLGYGVAGGLLVGYLVIRVDAFLSGTRGRRARRAEEAAAHRPEPARGRPLL